MSRRWAHCAGHTCFRWPALAVAREEPGLACQFLRPPCLGPPASCIGAPVRRWILHKASSLARLGRHRSYSPSLPTIATQSITQRPVRAPAPPCRPTSATATASASAIVHWPRSLRFLRHTSDRPSRPALACPCLAPALSRVAPEPFFALHTGQPRAPVRSAYQSQPPSTPSVPFFPFYTISVPNLSQHLAVPASALTHLLRFNASAQPEQPSHLGLGDRIGHSLAPR